MGDPFPGSVRCRVLVADDHQLMRDALAALIGTDPELELVASVSNGDAALESARRTGPDAIVVDHHMPGGGVGLVEQLSEQCPQARVVVLSVVADAHAEAYLAAGAHACVVKGGSPAVLLAAIKGAADPAPSVDPSESSPAER